MPESPLRDLARQLRDTARRHLAYSQVADFMNHVDDHLSALAFHEETNARAAHDRSRECPSADRGTMADVQRMIDEERARPSGKKVTITGSGT